MRFTIYAFAILLQLNVYASSQPNPPSWPSNVYAYTTATVSQSEIDAVYATNGGNCIADNGQFVNSGYAFLFAPGTYTGLQVNVGYYTSVIGLGATASATTINSVNSPQGGNTFVIGALNTFWRSAENFSTTPAEVWPYTSTIAMTWATSQACPLRKVHINGKLYLFQLDPQLDYNNGKWQTYNGGRSSGGFMADCSISATATGAAVIVGSQQQFCFRNCIATTTDGSSAFSNGVWNQVFVGCSGAPASHCSTCPNGTVPPCSCLNCYTLDCTPTCVGDPYTTIDETPLIAEKPYIVSDGTLSAYSLYVPRAQTNHSGLSTAVNDIYPFTQVLVATTSTPVATINAEIEAGNHVILTPGVYQLSEPIVINRDNTVVLGIGFPILISTLGKSCVEVGDVNGVRIGGILLQAGPSTDPVTPTLLRWGTVGGGNGVTSGFLYDCFARVGRFDSGNSTFNRSTLMVQINSSNIVCDNCWFWRADHDAFGLVYNGDNPCTTAVEMNGDNIIAYGLACEHTLGDLAVWNGNGGKCYMFQAEFPYDVTADYETAGFVGYRVGNSVTEHKGYGIGAYSFFRDYCLSVDMAISAPVAPGIEFTAALSRYLTGFGGIRSVLNGVYGINTLQSNTCSVNAEYPGPAYLCHYVGQGPVVKTKLARRAR